MYMYAYVYKYIYIYIHIHTHIYILAVLGVELGASHMPGSHSTTWTTPPALFALVIFEIELALCLGLPGPHPPICASPCIWDDRPIPTCLIIG
jgi:hypothetical protein